MHPAFISYGSLRVKELPLHRNLGMELVYVSEGSLRWIADGRQETISSGSVFFTLPWQAHGSQALHEPGNHVHYLQFKLDRIYRRPVSTFEFHSSLHIPEPAARRISRVFAATARHSWPASRDLSIFLLTLVRRLESSADPLLIEGLFRIVIAELADIVSDMPCERIPASPAEQRVDRFLEQMNQRCERNWRLEEMARTCGMGRSLFAETVRKLTGDVPSVHLRRLRVDRAEQLLRETEMSMTEIGLACGFATSQLFSRTFREFTRRTPSQFRQESRNPSPQPIQDFTTEEERRRLDAVRQHAWV